MDLENLNIVPAIPKESRNISQRIIETSITDKLKNGTIDIGDEIELEMKLSINSFNQEHTIKDKIFKQQL